MNNTGKKFGAQNLNSSYIWYMNKLGEGFKNFSRTQIGIFWFFIGVSIGCIIVTLLS